MNAGDERKPLVASRGLVPIGEFCRRTGIEAPTVEALVLAGELDGISGRDGRIVGLFDDALPSAERLRALGLTVGSDYDPNELRSHEDAGDDPDAGDDSSPTWTMSWEGGTPP